jgi:hypothetical protein
MTPISQIPEAESGDRAQLHDANFEWRIAFLASYTFSRTTSTFQLA